MATSGTTQQPSLWNGLLPHSVITHGGSVEPAVHKAFFRGMGSVFGPGLWVARPTYEHTWAKVGGAFHSVGDYLLLSFVRFECAHRKEASSKPHQQARRRDRAIALGLAVFLLLA